MKIYWPMDCSSGVEDDPAEDECDIGGDEIGTVCENYSLSVRKKTGFTINETDLRTNNMNLDELAAINILRKTKELDEFWSKYMIAVIDASAGVNQLNDMYTVSGTETLIPAYAWNADLLGYLAMCMEVNRFSASYALSGRNLWLQKWNLDRESNLPESAAASGKLAELPMFFDLFNIESVIGRKKTYLINKNAVALVTKNYYGDTPIQVDNPSHKRYSAASLALPGVRYDWFYKTSCTAGKVKHHWTVRTKGGGFTHPTICNGQTNGIIALRCV